MQLPVVNAAAQVVDSTLVYVEEPDILTQQVISMTGLVLARHPKH